MSLFDSILEKLGIKKPAGAAAPAPAPQVKPPVQSSGLPTIEQQLGLPPKPVAQPAAPAPQAPPPVQAAPPKPEAAATPPPVSRPPGFVTAQAAKPETAAAPQPVQAEPAKPAAPVAIPVVDVVSKLEKLAAENPQKLDWKVSIVDMMKLLNMDSSFEARTELAKELGCPSDLMKESAKMNVWLHKTVLQKIADNGGNIPASLL